MLKIQFEGGAWIREQAQSVSGGMDANVYACLCNELAGCRKKAAFNWGQTEEHASKPRGNRREKERGQALLLLRDRWYEVKI